MFGKSLEIAALLAGLAGSSNLGVTGTPRRIRSRSGITRLKWLATCTSSQKTRNPADPAQAYLIARAEAKRARRAIKAQRDALHLLNTCRAWFNPLATDGCINGCKKNLYPFYINRSN